MRKLLAIGIKFWAWDENYFLLTLKEIQAQ